MGRHPKKLTGIGANWFTRVRNHRRYYQRGDSDRAWEMRLDEALEADMLRDVLADRNVTQRRLAEIVGVTGRTVRRWVAGESCPKGTLQQEALVSWLLGG